MGDELRVEATMGRKGSETLLLALGRTNDAAAVRASAATNLVLDLPLAMATNLVVLSSGNEVYAAKTVSVKSDGVDDFYMLRFARPTVNLLNFEATFFHHVENMGPGTFVVQGTNGEEIAAALLTREHCSVKIPIDLADTHLTAAISAMRSVAAVPSLEARPRPGFHDFFKLGVWHILTGFDHLLFLGALLVCVRRVGPMLAVITCFTLAHSVTLALAAMELINISSRIIEPLIAASIIVVGIENLIRREAQGDRYFMAGGFGLIHGFGFASALHETGLGRAGSEIVLPLFSFNLGVEAGQLAVATVVVPLLLWARRSTKFAVFGAQFISIGVILVSAYWFLERILAGP
ncbi:MAG: hypothetical protein RLY20_2291 [Verrucomicrobiota bacterium]